MNIRSMKIRPWISGLVCLSKEEKAIDNTSFE